MFIPFFYKKHFNRKMFFRLSFPLSLAMSFTPSALSHISFLPDLCHIFLLLASLSKLNVIDIKAFYLKVHVVLSFLSMIFCLG